MSKASPLIDKGKIKPSQYKNLKEVNRPNYSPYTGSEKGKYKQLWKGKEKKIKKKVKANGNGHITIFKKKPSIHHGCAPSRGSKIPTTATSTHTSSIPTLPSVVKDSWFKDKVSRQNLDGIKRRFALMLSLKITFLLDYKLKALNFQRFIMILIMKIDLLLKSLIFQGIILNMSLQSIVNPELTNILLIKSQKYVSLIILILFLIYLSVKYRRKEEIKKRKSK